MPLHISSCALESACSCSGGPRDEAKPGWCGPTGNSQWPAVCETCRRSAPSRSGSPALPRTPAAPPPLTSGVLGAAGRRSSPAAVPPPFALRARHESPRSSLRHDSWMTHDSGAKRLRRGRLAETTSDRRTCMDRGLHIGGIDALAGQVPTPFFACLWHGACRSQHCRRPLQRQGGGPSRMLRSG